MGKKVTVDLTGVESFQRCSEGIHTVKVASAEVKQSQGGNDMIVVAFEVTKGADKGSRVYENFPLVDAALWKLKGFLVAIGMKADGKVSVDLDKLIGKVCNINVIHEEYEGKLRARCESIMKFAAESSDDDDEDEDDDDDEVPFGKGKDDDDEEEEEEKPKKKSGKDKATSKKAHMNPPEDEDDDDWDDDDDEEEEEEEKPTPKKKSAPKEDKKAKPEKKPAKKSKKDEDEDDDWDDDDWDEEDE